MSWNVDTMRKQLQSNTHYKYSERWYDRVAKMSDKQVIAIWLRLKSEGQIKV